MVAHPAEYYAYAAKATGTTPAVVAQSLPVTSYPSAPFSPGGLTLLDGTITFLRAHDLEKAPVDLDAWKVDAS